MMEAPSDLRADGLVNPLGLERRAPRLSWRTPTGFDAVAAEVELDGAVVRVESVHPWVDWPCAPLADRQRATWRVRLVNATAAVTPWSAQTWCEAGIADANWKAGWVDAPGFGHPLLRCRFDVGDPAELARARLYFAGLGLCVVTLNGVRVGDRVIFPHHTDWTRRVEYQVDDLELFDAGPWLRRWLDDVAEIQNADTGVRFAPMAPVAPRMIAKPRCHYGRHRFAAQG